MFSTINSTKCYKAEPVGLTVNGVTNKSTSEWQEWAQAQQNSAFKTGGKGLVW